jgi:cyclase
LLSWTSGVRNSYSYFRLEEVAGGVFAAVVTPGVGAMGNAAIVDLGERTLVFDTFLTTPAARELREAAERLTGRAASLVVNSHRHADHVMGNQVFVPDAVVISTANTRERLRISPLFQQLPALIAGLEERIAGERDEASRSALSFDLADYGLLGTEAHDLQRVLADVTFDQHLTLYGSKRRAELITYGGGHTSSDAFVYLPDDRVALMGDLLFVGSHPGFAHGDPREWQRILRQVLELDLECVVPGHGPVGTALDLDSELRYLVYTEELARSVIRAERTKEEALEEPLPPPFQAWRWRNVLADNLTFLLDYLPRVDAA